MNFYAYVTVKNINFKEYISYIYIGLDMLEHLEKASIFLIGKPNIVYEEQFFHDQTITDSEFQALIREKQEDYIPDI